MQSEHTSYVHTKGLFLTVMIIHWRDHILCHKTYKNERFDCQKKHWIHTCIQSYYSLRNSAQQKCFNDRITNFMESLDLKNEKFKSLDNFII